MPHDFIVLATVRSGSYHLTSLLDSAPDLVCHGEVYKPRQIEVPAADLARLGLRAGDVEARAARGGGFLAELAALHADKGVGFKIFPAHLRANPEVEQAILEGSQRVVVLLRPLLEICVSLKAATVTGQFTRRADEARQAMPPVEITDENLMGARGIFRSVRRKAKLIEATDPSRMFRIPYKDLTNPRRIDALLAHLGSTAKAADLASTYAKQSAAPLHERVANWPEVVRGVARLDVPNVLAEAGYAEDGTPL